MKTTFELSHINSVVKDHIIPCMAKHHIFAFIGPLGAGKTTLIKELLHQCGVTQNITSPTFNYVNTYQSKQNMIFHHFDLYRIKNLDDFINAGFDEYFQQTNTWCFVEWPEVIDLFLKSRPEAACYIKLSYIEQDPALRQLEIYEPR